MRIRGRLLLLLAIPLVALLGVTGYGVVAGATRWSEASQLQERTDLGLIAQDLAADLQRERRLLIEEGRTDPDLRAAIEAADREVRSRAERIGGSLLEPAASVTRRMEGIHRIANARLGGQVALRTYGLTVDDLLRLADEALDPRGSIDDAAASTAVHLTRARAASSEEHDRLVHLTRSGHLDPAGFQQLTALGSAQERYAELAAASATSDDLRIRIERVGHQMRFADLTRSSALTRPEQARSDEWRQGLMERAEALDELHADAAVAASEAVDELARDSRLLLVGAAASAVAIVLVSALLLRRALRTIARPLQDLAAQAEDVARSRLPEAVAAQQERGGEELHLPALRATGAAEVHEVAAAFNDVQNTALRLAGKQAALRVNQAEALTNLGRRNQTLLARQLDFISSLETRETDPAFLEHLFKLDHLASRMRRNAESLLILAGSETPRRRRTPAPVTEVVRAAMSEVEEFERVRIGHLRDATVAGPIVIDLVHLLAELIENALGFSPPETTVEIDGRSLGQGGYQFAVIDHGVGMTEVELIAANERMSGNDELEGMPTRYLGQYVVAKLATKIGAMVRLQHSAGGRGVTATVNLPASAILGSPDRSSVAGPLPGSRAAREQGPTPFAPGAGVSEAARMAAHAEPAPEPATTGSAGDGWDSYLDLESPVPTRGTPAETGGDETHGDVGEPAASGADPVPAADLTTGAAEPWTVEAVAGQGEASFGEPQVVDEEAGPAGFGPTDTTDIIDTTDTDTVDTVEQVEQFDRADPADHTDPVEQVDPVGDAAWGDRTGWDSFTQALAAEEATPVAHDPTAVGEDPAGTWPATGAEPEVEGEPVAVDADPFARLDADPFAPLDADPYEPRTDADPADQPWDVVDTSWEGIDAATDGSTEAAAVQPPPAPAEVPVQPDWEPEVAAPEPEPVASAEAEAEADGVEQPTAPAPVAANGFGAHDGFGGDERVEPDRVEAEAPSLTAPSIHPGPARTGGLARRVPGASLAARRGLEVGATAPQPAQRSANDVRQMLSTFQAGRRRGRDEAPRAVPGGPEETVGDDQQDRRFTT